MTYNKEKLLVLAVMKSFAIIATVALAFGAAQGLAQDAPLPAVTVATAVNGMFVARERRAQQVLQPGDSVTTFQPIVGG
mgnify:CR=1 FL=1